MLSRNRCYDISLTSSLIFWNPFTCFLKSLFSFAINFILTFSCHPSCFCICHTKNIISLDSTVHTTVTWDWFSKSLNFFMWLGYFYTIESSICTVLILSTISFLLSMKCSIVIRLSSIIFILFFNSCIWATSSIECMDLGWWNWL